jgi:multicomponent Na+:H+ antiporter subunit G
MIPEALALLGAVLTLLSATGVVRFTDIFERSHALTKASTVGLVLVLIGAAVEVGNANDATNLILAGILQVITMPVGANLMNAAVYRAVGIPHRVDTIDELAQRADNHSPAPVKRPTMPSVAGLTEAANNSAVEPGVKAVDDEEPNGPRRQPGGI